MVRQGQHQVMLCGISGYVLRVLKPNGTAPRQTKLNLFFVSTNIPHFIFTLIFFVHLLQFPRLCSRRCVSHTCVYNINGFIFSPNSFFLRWLFTKPKYTACLTLTNDGIYGNLWWLLWCVCVRLHMWFILFFFS